MSGIEIITRSSTIPTIIHPPFPRGVALEICCPPRAALLEEAFIVYCTERIFLYKLRTLKTQGPLRRHIGYSLAIRPIHNLLTVPTIVH